MSNTKAEQPIQVADLINLIPTDRFTDLFTHYGHGTCRHMKHVIYRATMEFIQSERYTHQLDDSRQVLDGLLLLYDVFHNIECDMEGTV